MRRPNPTRRQVLQILGAGAAGALLPGCETGGRRPGERSGGRRPNILFIMSDDHGAQAIGAYGSYRNRTPGIDRLAHEGMRFDNCFCTNAICAPSRAVILTGRHSHLNGQLTNRGRFEGAQETFPKLLRRGGYQTALFGKWHLKSEPTGFDHWDVLKGQGPYYNPLMIRNGERRKLTGYTTDIITDLSLEWLEGGRDPDRPFLMMCQHKAPHRNWQPGPDHLTLYDGETIPEPTTLFDDWSGRGTAAREQEMTIARHLTENDLKLVPPRNLTPAQRARWDAAYGPKNAAFRSANLAGEALMRWKYQRYVKDYLRCVASVDDNVGRLLRFLDEAGLAEDTLVVYTSDQGWYLGEHGWYDKRWMYEESLRMPFLVRWPGVVRAGSVNADLCQNLDFAETFLDAADVPIPGGMQGRSLVPLLAGRAVDWRQAIYYHYYEHPAEHNVQRHEGVRTRRYKLIHFYRLGEWELYDLERDPDELSNVYGQEAYERVTEDLKAELRRLRQQYGVPDPTAEA
jgi:arylsulfatase A-like enzyme